jgi:hypothetical protein
MTSKINRTFFFDQVNLRLLDGKLPVKARATLEQSSTIGSRTAPRLMIAGLLTLWEPRITKPTGRSVRSANMDAARERNIRPTMAAGAII